MLCQKNKTHFFQRRILFIRKHVVAVKKSFESTRSVNYVLSYTREPLDNFLAYSETSLMAFKQFSHTQLMYIY